MKSFGHLDDSIIYPTTEAKNCDIFEKRTTVKIVIVRDDNKICLVTNPVHNFFLLPGGGVEAGELPEEAAKRECREEAGYEIEIVQNLGEIKEQRARDCREYHTFLYLAKAKKKTSADERTESEVMNQLSAHWMSYQKALEICEQQYQTLTEGKVNFYNTGFNIYRDRMFLLYAHEKRLEKIS